MSAAERRNQQVEPEPGEQMLLPSEQLSLAVTLDIPAGSFLFEWSRADGEFAGRARLFPTEATMFGWRTLECLIEQRDTMDRDSCNRWPASTTALLNRLRKRFPASRDALRIGLLTDTNLGPAQAGQWLPLTVPAEIDPWKWLGREVLQFCRVLE